MRPGTTADPESRRATSGGPGVVQGQSQRRAGPPLPLLLARGVGGQVVKRTRQNCRREDKHKEKRDGLHGRMLQDPEHKKEGNLFLVDHLL